MKTLSLSALVFCAVATSASVRAVPMLDTYVQSSTYGLSDSKSGPPSSSITSSFDHHVQSDSISAAASADVEGRSAVKVDGLFASPMSDINFATARAKLTYSTINNSGAAADYRFSFRIVGPRIELFDSAGLGSNSPGAPDASYLAEVLVNGNSVWSSSAELNGGRIGQGFDKFDMDLGSTFLGGGRIGYQFGDYTGALDLGTFADGATITVEAILQVDLNSAGFELGASASIGDPNDLAANPGVVGMLEAVHEPSSALLLALGVASFALPAASFRSRGGMRKG